MENNTTILNTNINEEPFEMLIDLFELDPICENIDDEEASSNSDFLLSLKKNKCE